jgi:hypothetical protein
MSLDSSIWQRVADGIYIGALARHPAFGYILERSRGGWLVRCRGGSYLRNMRGGARTFRTLDIAAMNAIADGVEAILGDRHR